MSPFLFVNLSNISEVKKNQSLSLKTPAKSDHYEALVKEIKNPSAQVCADEEASLLKQKIAIVGRTVTKRLLGKSSKAQFVPETDALEESIINEYDQVILATFDLPFAIKKRIDFAFGPFPNEL